MYTQPSPDLEVGRHDDAVDLKPCKPHLQIELVDGLADPDTARGRSGGPAVTELGSAVSRSTPVPGAVWGLSHGLHNKLEYQDSNDFKGLSHLQYNHQPKRPRRVPPLGPRAARVVPLTPEMPAMFSERVGAEELEASVAHVSYVGEVRLTMDQLGLSKRSRNETGALNLSDGDRCADKYDREVSALSQSALSIRSAVSGRPTRDIIQIMNTMTSGKQTGSTEPAEPEVKLVHSMLGEPPAPIVKEEKDEESGDARLCVIPGQLYWAPLKGKKACDVGSCRNPAYQYCDQQIKFLPINKSGCSLFKGCNNKFCVLHARIYQKVQENEQVVDSYCCVVCQEKLEGALCMRSCIKVLCWALLITLPIFAITLLLMCL